MATKPILLISQHAIHPPPPPRHGPPFTGTSLTSRARWSAGYSGTTCAHFYTCRQYSSECPEARNLGTPREHVLEKQETGVGSYPHIPFRPDRTTDSATKKTFLKVHKGLPTTTLVQFCQPYVATPYGNSIADVGFGIPREIMCADPWNDKKIAFRYSVSPLQYSLLWVSMPLPLPLPTKASLLSRPYRPWVSLHFIEITLRTSSNFASGKATLMRSEKMQRLVSELERGYHNLRALVTISCSSNTRCLTLYGQQYYIRS